MEEQRLPKRPKAHVTGDRAVRVFEYYCRPQWVVNWIRSDYGFDITITTERAGTVQDLLLAQLKGSKSPGFACPFFMPGTSGHLSACLFGNGVIHDKKEDRMGVDSQMMEELGQSDLCDLFHGPDILSEESCEA